MKTKERGKQPVSFFVEKRKILQEFFPVKSN